MDQYKPLPIVLQVNDSTGKVLRRTIVDFHDATKRTFIAKTAWWAMHNGHTMTTRALKAGEVVEEVERSAPPTGKRRRSTDTDPPIYPVDRLGRVHVNSVGTCGSRGFAMDADISGMGGIGD